MTQPTDLHTRLSALLATVAPNPGTVATAQRERDRGILEALNDIVLRVEVCEAETKRAADTMEFMHEFHGMQIEINEQLRKHDDDNASAILGVLRGLEQRIAALEARQEQTGEGK